MSESLVSSSVTNFPVISSETGSSLLNESVKAGVFNLVDSVISNCSANYDGAIFNAGGKTANIARSTLSGNQAANDSGIFNHSLTLTSNSTVSGNTLPGKGGGICNEQPSDLETTKTTVADNTVRNNLGGIRKEAECFLGMRNSIVADNHSNGGG